MSDSKYHQALSANRKLVAEIDRLKADNERLRKDKENADGYIRSLEKQLAAKEGRNAK